jgi:hypothetical protein
MDNEDAITKAFNTFDLNDSGSLNVEDLRTALTTLGDKLTDKEVRNGQLEATSEANVLAHCAFLGILDEGDVRHGFRHLWQLRLREVRQDHGGQEQQLSCATLYINKNIATAVLLQEEITARK